MKAEEYFWAEFEKIGKGLHNTLQISGVINVMTQYAKLKCKEQREICANEADWLDQSRIENAKEPEL